MHAWWAEEKVQALPCLLPITTAGGPNLCNSLNLINIGVQCLAPLAQAGPLVLLKLLPQPTP